ncbi:MAG: carboxypeptidase-like regulatory domain-containing protein [Balneolaceae bacterium]|nr:carboxypeptidase-like regulatory domain-containing protein [Balneolaceae bacterium]
MFNNKINIIATVGLLVALFVTTSAAVQAQANSQQDSSAAAITGKVIDAETTQAVAGIEVKLQGTEKTSQTNEEGVFKFEELEQGTHAVTIEAEGYEMVTKEIEVPSSEEITIELQPSS